MTECKKPCGAIMALTKALEKALTALGYRLDDLEAQTHEEHTHDSIRADIAETAQQIYSLESDNRSSRYSLEDEICNLRSQIERR